MKSLEKEGVRPPFLRFTEVPYRPKIPEGKIEGRLPSDCKVTAFVADSRHLGTLQKRRNFDP